MLLQDTATALLLLLDKMRAARPAQPEVEGSTLHEITGLAPLEINDAIALLEKSGYAECRRYIGTAPYTFGYVWITPVGRYEAERASGPLAEPLPLLAGPGAGQEQKLGSSLKPEPPGFIKNLAWLLKHGWEHRKLVSLAAVIVVLSWGVSKLQFPWKSEPAQAKPAPSPPHSAQQGVGPAPVSKPANTLHIPEDVDRLWVFYQKRGVENQNQTGCSSPMGANPRIERVTAIARIDEFVAHARQHNVKLIFAAHSEKRGYVGAAEDMRFNDAPLKRNASHWCDGEARDGYEVPL